MSTVNDAATETETAREAMLELLATTLDAALPLVVDHRRAERLPEIAALCSRIGFLGEAAQRLGA